MGEKEGRQERLKNERYGAGCPYVEPVRSGLQGRGTKDEITGAYAGPFDEGPADLRKGAHRRQVLGPQAGLRTVCPYIAHAKGNPGEGRQAQGRPHYLAAPFARSAVDL